MSVGEGEEYRSSVLSSCQVILCNPVVLGEIMLASGACFCIYAKKEFEVY